MTKIINYQIMEDNISELKERVSKEIKYIGLDIGRHNVPDICGEKFYDQIPTNYIEIEFFDKPLQIPLCEKHAEKIENIILELKKRDYIDIH